MSFDLLEYADALPALGATERPPILPAADLVCRSIRVSDVTGFLIIKVSVEAAGKARLFDDSFFFSSTIASNLAVSPSRTSTAVMGAAAKVGLS